MVRERPILFSTAMVQAILAGRKTQTRRIAKHHPAHIYNWTEEEMEGLEHKYIKWVSEDEEGVFGPEWVMLNGDGDMEGVLGLCPYGKPGDVLWVRETFRKYFNVDEDGYPHYDDVIIEYAADNPEPIYMRDGDGFQMFNKDGSERYLPYSASIHMPKAIARIWLQIEDVSIERLQDITEEDAKAEGVKIVASNPIFNFYKSYMPERECFNNAYNSFQTLWQSINGVESWNANPWVWVVKYKVLSTTGKPAFIK